MLLAQFLLFDIARTTPYCPPVFLTHSAIGRILIKYASITTIFCERQMVVVLTHTAEYSGGDGEGKRRREWGRM